MVFIVVFLNEGPLEKQHLLKGYPSQIYQIKSNQIKCDSSIVWFEVFKVKKCFFFSMAQGFLSTKLESNRCFVLQNFRIFEEKRNHIFILLVY